MTIDFDHYRTWIGRTEQFTDVINSFPANALAAALDLPTHFERGSALPRLWHWMYFLGVSPRAELGTDGHPRRGGFLPPVALPRRMWAGGRLAFYQPLRVGDTVTRDSQILDVKYKQGKTGDLMFISVKHSFVRVGEVLLIEEHDLVYRGEAQRSITPSPPFPAPDASAPTVSKIITPDATLLFRYSALTFNGHRIHYDHPYATQVEGYPGLVVHGPLIATLLMQLLDEFKPNADTARFSFRAVSPLCADQSFSISLLEQGSRYKLRASNQYGVLAMEAEAELHS